MIMNIKMELQMMQETYNDNQEKERRTEGEKDRVRKKDELRKRRIE